MDDPLFNPFQRLPQQIAPFYSRNPFNQVLIADIYGLQQFVSYHPDRPILDLLHSVGQAWNVDISWIELIFKGRVLNTHHLPRDYKIYPSATIHIAYKYPITVVMPNGRKFDMRISEKDDFEVWHRQVAHFLRKHPNTFVLHDGRHVLKSGHTLRSYGLKPKHPKQNITVQLIPKMKISLYDRYGLDQVIYASRYEEVQDLRFKVAEAKHIPPNGFALLHRGEVLEDCFRLCDYGIQHGNFMLNWAPSYQGQAIHIEPSPSFRQKTFV